MRKTARRFPTILLLAAAVAAPLGARAAAGEGEGPRVRTDRAVIPPPPAPPLPKAGGVLADPAFGTRILRVTDERDGPENQHAYSYWCATNADSTRLIVSSGGRAMLYRFDPRGFRLLGKDPLFARPPPGGGTPGWEDAVWSARDPGLLYCREGLRLWACNVRTGAYTLVKDFSKDLPPGHLRQMSACDDGQTFAFSRQEPKWRVVGYLVWRRGEDRILLRRDTTQLDEVQVDKTGRYLVVKTGQGGGEAVEVRVVDLETGGTEDLLGGPPDFAPGHSDNGRGVVVGHDDCRNRLLLRRLDRPHACTPVLEFGSDWSQDYHISMRARDESWVLLSLYVSNTHTSSGLFRNEILQAATDGSGRVRRLAHHRSAVRSYWDSPRACISRDGRFVVFTSHWEGRGQRDVFVLEVPEGP